MGSLRKRPSPPIFRTSWSLARLSSDSNGCALADVFEPRFRVSQIPTISPDWMEAFMNDSA